MAIVVTTLYHDVQKQFFVQITSSVQIPSKFQRGNLTTPISSRGFHKESFDRLVYITDLERQYKNHNYIKYGRHELRSFKRNLDRSTGTVITS